MSTFGWPNRLSTASVDKRKPSDENHETSANDQLIQTDLNQKSIVYTSLSNTYSTEPYTNSAKCISEQIKDDKLECRAIVAQYGVDPNEFLHLLEQWTQHLIYEFKQRREHFKLLLKERWERGELNGMKSDDDSNRRLVHVHVQKLSQWRQTGPIDLKRQFEELKPTSDVKEITRHLIDELLQIMHSIILIHQNITNEIHHDRTNYLNETNEQLKRIGKLNEKEYNTICIIGLEKAGKSSFINALLGFVLLPHKIERCTQIQTILKPLSKSNRNLFATIEFYHQNEFTRFMENLPKEKDETDDAFQKRIKTIRQLRQNLVVDEKLLQEYQATEREQITDKLHEYIANISFLTIVKHVTIYTDKLPGENYILLDVPGCDSPIVEHRASAIDAVRNADAFLFLTDGQRPSLTNEQIRLLNEIQEGHFEGMKRAFGIITKLDLCQTRSKYLEHRAKAQSELEQKGFRTEHIFTVAANINLLEETKSNLEELTRSKERSKDYDALLDGFDQAKKTINQFIEYELPQSRLRQIVDLVQQKLVRYVQNALKLGEQLIPSNTQQISLDDYIKQINAEKWNDIFHHERYQPVLAKASYWQRETLALRRMECSKSLTQYFHDQFQFHTENIIQKNHPIEQVMLEQHDISILQMNPYDIETKEREKIVQSMLQAVRDASNELAIHMYEKYLQQLEKLLNKICPEQGDLFQSSLTLEHCAIEVRTLISRVTHPIIIATIRWPHVYNDNRIESARELARIAPTIAFNVRENEQTESNDHHAQKLGQTMAIIFEDFMTNKSQLAIFMALFRR